MPSKLLSYLGLCARARGLQSGAQAIEGLLHSGRCRLCLVDTNMSPPQQKKLLDLCRGAGVPLAQPPGDLGAAIGQPGRMCIAITDPVWADQINKQLEMDRVPILAGV